MIVIGVDAHKRTHTMVAVDARGQQIGEKTVGATTAGHLTALQWATAEFGLEMVWAVEDSRALTARLERDLLSAGHTVIRVPTLLMARTRRSARERGKSDPIDALATARAAQREPNLPLARHHRWSRELKLLIERRDDLVQQRTATVQRLLWRVHELDPTYRIKPGALSWRPQQAALVRWLTDQRGLVAELAGEELTEVVRLTPIINAAGRRIDARIRTVAPSLLALHGCGTVTAARIVGETADVARFRSEAAFARYAGLAPVPEWSGASRGRVRSHRGGNRALNAAIHQIAMTQIKKGGPAEDYYRRRRAERDLHGYAINGVKRRLARIVFQRLRADQFPALIAELTLINQEWADCLPDADIDSIAPRITRGATGPRNEDPRFAKSVRITEQWAAMLG